MYGEWIRLTPAELERAQEDLDWAHRYASDRSKVESDQGEELPVAQRRSFGSDKTWHALMFLLGRRDFPIDIVTGEWFFTEDTDDESQYWGYSPPGFLLPDEVRRASEALEELTAEDLIRGVDQAELAAAEIYPSVWGSPGELEWAVSFFPDVKAYFAAAASSGDAIVCWIS
ncbi:DUF1877 family protein [Hamadaea sp.]|uniref:DUF1877 family protein n=1 Tax=Hamadaea sp. TaxID=2024425 RepID=UPI0025C18F8B|nr:DUF1877 family protein [Hamadaea sp.]